MRETFTVFGLIAPLAGLLLMWHALPARVGIHFDLSGRPDGFGPRASLFLLPGIAILLYCFLLMLSRFPQTFNLPVPPGAPERGRYEAVAVELFAWLRLEIVWMFAVLSALDVRSALSGRGVLILWILWILPAQLLILGLTIAFYLRRIRGLAASFPLVIESSRRKA